MLKKLKLMNMNTLGLENLYHSKKYVSRKTNKKCSVNYPSSGTKVVALKVTTDYVRGGQSINGSSTAFQSFTTG